ncbi:hypothetical protein LT493_12075 [Streptomyces tricolor]|nr:hypothetical protein [Streptomyces tricolor]
MDPQQRLLLELCWHALEDARIPPTAGGATGVFVGSLLGRLRAAEPYVRGGGRLHHDRHGPDLPRQPPVPTSSGSPAPAQVVDTGQSSSLTALDQALGSLRRGECTTAVVAGVQLNLTPTGDRLIEELGAMSPDRPLPHLRRPRRRDRTRRGRRRPGAQAPGGGRRRRGPGVLHGAGHRRQQRRRRPQPDHPHPGRPAEPAGRGLPPSGRGPGPVSRTMELHGTGTKAGDPGGGPRPRWCPRPGAGSRTGPCWSAR